MALVRLVAGSLPLPEPCPAIGLCWRSALDRLKALALCDRFGHPLRALPPRATPLRWLMALVLFPLFWKSALPSTNRKTPNLLPGRANRGFTRPPCFIRNPLGSQRLYQFRTAYLPPKAGRVLVGLARPSSFAGSKPLMRHSTACQNLYGLAAFACRPHRFRSAAACRGDSLPNTTPGNRRILRLTPPARGLCPTPCQLLKPAQVCYLRPCDRWLSVWLLTVSPPAHGLCRSRARQLAFAGSRHWLAWDDWLVAAASVTRRGRSHRRRHPIAGSRRWFCSRSLGNVLCLSATEKL